MLDGLFLLINPAMASMVATKIAYDWIIKIFKVKRLPPIIGRPLTKEESAARRDEIFRDMFWQDLMVFVPTFLFAEVLVYLCKGVAGIPDMFCIALFFGFIYVFGGCGGGLYD
jgi:hypothetical protein